MKTCSKNSILATRELFQYLNEKNVGRCTGMSRIAAYCDLLRKTSMGFVSRSLQNQVCGLRPNKCCVTTTELADDWSWSRPGVRAFLERLETYGQITAQRQHQCLLITMPADDTPSSTDEEECVQTFTSRLRNVAAKWTVYAVDDDELVEKINKIIHARTSLTTISGDKDTMQETLAKPIVETMVENHGNYSVTLYGKPDSVGCAVMESAVQDVIDELVLATFLKTVRAHCTRHGKQLCDFLHITCSDDWTSFLHSMSHVARLIVGHHADSLKPTPEEDSLCVPYMGVLAECVTKIIGDEF